MFSHRQVTAPANKFRQTHTSQNTIWTAQAQTHQTFTYDLTGWSSTLWFFIWLIKAEVFLDIWWNNLAILNRVWITIVGTWITYSTCKLLNCLQRFDLVCKCLSLKKKKHFKMDSRMSIEENLNQVTGKYYHHCGSNFQDLTKVLY